jgi:hypothetical protein
MDPVHTAFLHTIVSGAQFTDQFGVAPELEFTETPLGMMYIATRRVGDHVWARMVEAISPNRGVVINNNSRARPGHSTADPVASLLPHLDTTEVQRYDDKEADLSHWGSSWMSGPGRLSRPRGRPKT